MVRLQIAAVVDQVAVEAMPVMGRIHGRIQVVLPRQMMVIAEILYLDVAVLAVLVAVAAVVQKPCSTFLHILKLMLMVAMVVLVVLVAAVVARLLSMQEV